jgi:predicted metal-dependent peptidase
MKTTLQDHLRKVRTGDLTSLTKPGKVRRESETKIQKANVAPEMILQKTICKIVLKTDHKKQKNQNNNKKNSHL